MAQRRVLLTGAAGSVARQLLPGLAGYDVRLMDRVEPPDGLSGAERARWVTADLTDRTQLAALVDGVDAVVHLAGDPRPDAEWDDLEPANVDGFVALLAAAQEHGVDKVVFASSVHAMGQYEAQGRVPISPDWAPSPCCVYGATKAFDEAVARVFAYRTGLRTIGLRLGATVPEPTEANQLAGWLGPEDLRQLVVKALEAQVRFGVYAGVSANTRQRWELGNASADLGYEPVLDSESFAAHVGDGPSITTCPRPRT